MCKKTLLIVLITISNFYSSQDRENDSLQAIADFSKLSAEYQSRLAIRDGEIAKFNALKDQMLPQNMAALQDSFAAQSDLTMKSILDLDNTYKIAESYKVVYVSKGFSKDFIDSLFNYNHTPSGSEIKTTGSDSKGKLIYLFGDKPIEENDEIFTNKSFRNVFEEVISTDSKAYLGDFRIPQKNQVVQFYEYIDAKTSGKLRIPKIKTSGYYLSNSGESLKFQKVKVHILEGSIYDLQVYLTDQNNNVYFYENKHPISLLRYTKAASINFIPLKLVSSSNVNVPIDASSIAEFFIKVSDVLMYIPNPGENYVPEDLTLTFPNKENEEIHANHPLIYKVQQNTALQDIVEFRTYTDFLGLFGDAPNGLVQLEGKADFFVNPFNIRNNYFFKKVTPFVNFSRLDEDIRYLKTSIDEPSGTLKINKSLEIIEKSYLEMGVKLTAFSFKLRKEYPFSINLYGAARYQIADIRNANAQATSLKVLGLGGGLMFDFKRYNNFGFMFSSELTNFNVDSFNTEPTIVNPKDFIVFKNEAEVYYNPAGSKQSSIFLRLKTFNNSGKGNNEAFYQLQFGYRFSIGVNKLTQ